MHSHLLFLALDVAREREAEARAARLAASLRPATPRFARARRLVARAAVAVARRADADVIPGSRQAPGSTLAAGWPGPSAR